MTIAPDPRLLAVARGDEPADLVIANARVLCVFTREWLEADVAIAGERIAGFAERGAYAARETYDATGRYLVPGYVDAHVHIESSKLMVDEFARVILAHGTTTIVSDPHEIANVLGTDGIHWLLDCCDEVPVDVFVMASSSVPASVFESPRRPFSPGDLASILHRRRALGIAEMMNFPGVIAGDPAELAKLDRPGATHADGHAPGVGGLPLNAYLAAGIRTDHEATTAAEALERRRKGAWVLLREASNASNVRDLCPSVVELGPEGCAFCTDDREPDDLVDDGQIDLCCRIAVAAGVPPEHALVMATLHAARAHGLADRGAVAPGLLADLALLDDLVSFTPRDVWKAGAHLVRDGVARAGERIPVPAWVRSTVHVAPVGLSDLRVRHRGGRIRVIETIPGQLLTRHLVEEPTRARGARRRRSGPRPRQDRRRRAPSGDGAARPRVRPRLRPRTGRLRDDGGPRRAQHRRGRGLRRGHGAGDPAARRDRRRDRRRRGGARPRRARPADRGAPGRRLRGGGRGAARPAPPGPPRELGATDPSPFMTASFLALSVIPSLKITDHGLVDVDRFRLVDLHEDAEEDGDPPGGEAAGALDP